ncbi:SNF2 family DNA-dependent ATPase [Salix suchowensis]|nr:SNF2 family DNA-dependent ATPase [Salix suchowensis]
MNDEEADIDMAEAVVKGFKENIRLLPHQVIGKKWMKEREDVTQKRYGGILADDMGYDEFKPTTRSLLTSTCLVWVRQSKRLLGSPKGALASLIKPMAGTPAHYPNVLRRHHIVVTTYDVVKSEYAVYRPDVKDESKSKAKKKKAATSDSDDDVPVVKKAAKKGPKRDAIFRIKWWRVILGKVYRSVFLYSTNPDSADEAHNIKNHITKGAVACCDLDAKFSGVSPALRCRPQAIMLRRTKTDTLNGKKLIELPARVVEIDYKEDLSVVDSTAAKNADDKADDADELANAFESLGVTKKCKVCQEDTNVDKRLDDHCEACGDLAYEARLKSSERPDSAKIRMILKLLQDVDDRSAEKRRPSSSPSSRACWIYPTFLREKGVKFVRYDGSMSRPEREESLDAIKKKSNVRCILISFKAGSTGSGLRSRSQIRTDPRCQHLQAMIAETVEDRILEVCFPSFLVKFTSYPRAQLQTKKRALAQAALSGDKLKNMRLGMDDLLALFRPGGRDDDDEGRLLDMIYMMLSPMLLYSSLRRMIDEA